MEFPAGIEHDQGRVLKLKKSIYGLKQAGRIWNMKIDASLKRLGYTRSKSDHCVYFKEVGDECYYIGLYVDDLMMIGPNADHINQLLDGLEEEYGVKRLGNAKYILGIQILRSSDGSIKLSQRRYLKEVLARFDLSNCRALDAPMSPSSPLLTTRHDKLKGTTIDQRRYRQLVGSLMYATTGTRPDLAFVVSLLGRFSNNPLQPHWDAAVDVLRYIKGSLDVGLTYKPGTSLQLRGRSDATWISCPDTSRSVNGYHINLAGAAIAWSSKRQRRCAVSSCDAEYLGLGDASRTIIGLRDFLDKLHIPQLGPTILEGDNQGANALAHNPEHHQRSRHVRLAEHLVREHVAQGLVDIQYLPTKEMLADMLTKPLAASKFLAFRDQLGLSCMGDF